MLWAHPVPCYEAEASSVEGWGHRKGGGGCQWEDTYCAHAWIQLLAFQDKPEHTLSQLQTQCMLAHNRNQSNLWMKHAVFNWHKDSKNAFENKIQFHKADLNTWDICESWWFQLLWTDAQSLKERARSRHIMLWERWRGSYVGHVLWGLQSSNAIFFTRRSPSQPDQFI